MKVIDATNQKLGRVATEAAMALMGKDNPEYTPNKLSGTEVHITNASKLSLTEKKKLEKIYKHYTGYPGGLREREMKKVIDTKGYEEVYRKAVRKMLPNNRLRALMLKNLKITD